MQRFIYFFGEGRADAGDELKHLVGGKGASLGEMTRAGFKVPPGFTISAECCDLFYKNQRRWPEPLESEIRANLMRLEKLIGQLFGGSDSLRLAVRSGAAKSMPGMMDTLLNVATWEHLVQAIDAVFGSWMSERAVAYRQHHQVDGLLGTAVNIQAMCPSAVSGVMFTANPVTGLEQIVIEASFGLGEALVLGKVTPDRFLLNKKTLGIEERRIAQARPSLSDDQLQELAKLGLRVEEYFKAPCDIEWGLAGGEFHLLQARPIQAHRWQSVGALAEIGQIRQDEITALRARAEPEGTVWSRFNLAEILPEPTPMTWAIIRGFMSPKGGFGQMYRDFGYDPDPALGDEGSYDLICGRVYCNLSREPRMQSRSLPFGHRFGDLKADPAKALYPKAVFNAARAGWRFWLFLPAAYFRLWRSAARVSRYSRTFASRFRQEIVPAFQMEVEKEAARDFSQFDTAQLRERFSYWVRRTLYDFARDSLKPTLLAGVALENLEGALTRRFIALGQKDPEPARRARELVRGLTMGIEPEPDANLPEAVRNVALERMDRDVFLERFGHRAHQEMELARPRWSEDPAAVDRLIHETRAAFQREPCTGPRTSHNDAWQRILQETKLPAFQALALEREVERLRTYLGLRESAKHYLLQGYALIRRVLVELDKRFGLEGGIFFLTPEELPELGQKDRRDEIAFRRRRRELALRIPVPQVLFSDELEAIGRDVQVAADGVYQGVPLSAGVAEGTALVLEQPAGARAPEEAYILVCPSTDPAWVPLFVNARGLVMETGGVLSHGAIVAREFGLPAVAGLPDIHRRLRTGQRLRVDGTTGRVNVLA